MGVYLANGERVLGVERFIKLVFRTTENPFFCVCTLIEYCIFRAFSEILNSLRRGIGVDKRIWNDSLDQARRTTMTMMTMTMTTTISRRRTPKPSQRWEGAGRGEGARS